MQRYVILHFVVLGILFVIARMIAEMYCGYDRRGRRRQAALRGHRPSPEAEDVRWRTLMRRFYVLIVALLVIPNVIAMIAARLSDKPMLESLADTQRRMGNILMVCGVLVVPLPILWQSFRTDHALEKARRMVQRKRAPEAIEFLRTTIQQDGPRGGRSFLLGRLLLDQQQFEEALQHLRAAEGSIEDEALGMNLQSYALGALGLSEEALACVESAFARFPDDPLTLCNYSEVMNQIGRLDEARTALAQAEQIVGDIGENNLDLFRRTALAGAREAAGKPAP